MDREQPESRLARRIVEVVLVATAIVVARSANDAFNIVKLTVLLVGAWAVALVGLRRVLVTGVLRVPRTRVGSALVLFLVLGAVAVVTSDATWRSLLGVYGRATGYSTYLAGGVLFAALLRSATPSTAGRVARAILVGAGIVGAYAVVQRIGGDPYEWTTPYGENAATSTLGNTNFVSGYLGTVLPIGIWATITWRDRARLAAGAATVVIALGILAARSQQGLVAAAAGLAVLGVVVAFEHGGARRRQLVAGILGLGLLAGIALGAGLAGSGPLARLNDTGYSYRRYYWSAAIEMAVDKPLSGVGFDRWAAHYRAVRPIEASSGATDTTDEPHSVPLNMLASGGIPLGLAYAVFIIAIGVALLRGLQRADGSQRLLLGAVGGAWVGYQLQSTVSIDVPALPTLHFVLAGLIVVLSGPLSWFECNIPFLVRTVERRTSKKNVELRTTPRLVPWQASVAVAVFGFAGLWQLTRPVRADLEIRAASTSVERGDVAAASDNLRSAFDLWGHEAEYHSIAGDIFARMEQVPIALRYYQRALSSEPRRFRDVVNAARAARVAEDFSEAQARYDEALRLDPTEPGIAFEVARFYLEVANYERASALLDRVIRARPGDEEVLIAVGDCRAGLGEIDDARQLYGEVLAAQPDDSLGRRMALADRFRRIGEDDRARAIYEEAIEIAPKDGSAYYALAEMAEEAGDVEQAIRLYELVIAVAPSTFDAAERIAELRGEGS